MTRDQNQHPADPGQRAGASEAERQTKISQLPLRRSKLSTEEAALLRELFPDIITGVLLKGFAPFLFSLPADSRNCKGAARAPLHGVSVARLCALGARSLSDT